eukprot:TRINITY_DN35569_c0_g1_i1.p1 TRINITY_DN35569_c0_g1~~TRINITY_DN35569_c0_g1_i1.p1  ORF type:complete len:473 (+),score=144.75 TRINITY_DN35569_c0_g1_i1:106-1524(+)
MAPLGIARWGVLGSCPDAVAGGIGCRFRPSGAFHVSGIVEEVAPRQLRRTVAPAAKPSSFVFGLQGGSDGDTTQSAEQQQQQAGGDLEQERKQFEADQQKFFADEAAKKKRQKEEGKYDANDEEEKQQAVKELQQAKVQLEAQGRREMQKVHEEEDRRIEKEVAHWKESHPPKKNELERRLEEVERENKLYEEAEALRRRKAYKRLQEREAARRAGPPDWRPRAPIAVELRPEALRDEPPEVHEPGPIMTPSMKEMMKPPPAKVAPTAKAEKPPADMHATAVARGFAKEAPPAQARSSPAQIAWSPEAPQGACDAGKVLALREALRGMVEALNPGDDDGRCMQEARAFDDALVKMPEGTNCSSSSYRSAARQAGQRFAGCADSSVSGAEHLTASTRTQLGQMRLALQQGMDAAVPEESFFSGLFSFLELPPLSSLPTLSRPVSGKRKLIQTAFLEELGGCDERHGSHIGSFL